MIKKKIFIEDYKWIEPCISSGVEGKLILIYGHNEVKYTSTQSDKLRWRYCLRNGD